MSNTGIPDQVADQWKELSPPFLREEEDSEKFGFVMGFIQDMLLEKAFQAQTIRIPGAGDVSQIPYLSEDSLLLQGPNEPNDGFIGRIQARFSRYKQWGSRRSVMRELQAYLQGLQPGVAAALPQMAIVAGNASVTTWDTLYQGSPLGALPYHTTISPANWNWDNSYKPWRSWLILYMAQVSTGLSGGISIDSSAAGTIPQGQNVNGVWVAPTSGAPVNYPWISASGFTGLTSAQVGQWITIASAGIPGNNGMFPIVQVNSPTSCVYANPEGTPGDAGFYSIGYYPFIGPAPVWGAPGYTIGYGQNQTPPIDLGTNINGVWQASPVTVENMGYQSSLSWGLSCPQSTIDTIRLLLQRWKSAGAYYPHIIVAFDGGDSTSGSAFSPNSTQGHGNPDGSFGGHGELVNGVWVPNRLVSSPFDAYCQGTGQAIGCTVENVT